MPYYVNIKLVGETVRTVVFPQVLSGKQAGLLFDALESSRGVRRLGELFSGAFGRFLTEFGSDEVPAARLMAVVKKGANDGCGQWARVCGVGETEEGTE